MPRNKKATIKDIAELVGVSPSAVAKALNNHPRISVKTKTAVLEAAKKLNYQKNHLSSALRKGKSNLVGVVVPRINVNFFSSVVENIEKVLNENGYNIVISQSNESFEKESECIESLLNIQVDGIIASIANNTTSLEHYEKIKSNGTKLVLFDRGKSGLNVDYVSIDDKASSYEVVEHLISKNRKRIAHISGLGHTKIYNDRTQGYKEALKKHQLPIDNEIIHECNLTVEDGRRITQQLLKLTNRPDAIFASGDHAALGVLQVLKEHSIKIPEEIALVGFSNEPFTELTSPSISTVDQQSKKMGEMTAQTFLDRMDNADAPVKHQKIKAELIIRDSS